MTRMEGRLEKMEVENNKLEQQKRKCGEILSRNEDIGEKSTWIQLAGSKESYSDRVKSETCRKCGKNCSGTDLQIDVGATNEPNISRKPAEDCNRSCHKAGRRRRFEGE